MQPDRTAELSSLLQQRLLILDGATSHVPLRHFAPDRLKAFAGLR